MRTVATAGHVDHGKSSLVLALTGTDPDRFPEEKARGLTIDLGFAFVTLPSGAEIAFVDVPGHVRFIKNMLAGVGAVDLAVLVVAATEGWMPQTEEHLRILELLGVGHGLIVLTKADLVDDETLELARLDVAEHVVDTPFAGAPVVVCDSRSGRGIDDVRSALDALVADAPPRPTTDRPRLWIDRVFAAKGAGTVVTGTLTGGPLGVDDELEVAGRGLRVRVRGLESAKRPHDRVEPGWRVAVNLVGVEHRDLARGDALVRPGQWRTPTVVDVGITPVPGQKVARRARVQVYAGSGEHAGWVRLLDPDGRFARVRLATPLPLAPGDRLVLRDPGRRRTVAGAVVLENDPAGRAADAPARLALPLGPRLVATHGWLTIDDLPTRTGLPRTGTQQLVAELTASGAAEQVEGWLVDPAVRATLRDGVRERVAAHHRARPTEAGIEVTALASALRLDPTRLRAALVETDGLVVERGIVREPAHLGAVADSPEGHAVVAAFAAAPFAPPAPSEVGAPIAVIRALVRAGALVDVDGTVFAAGALEDAKRQVVELLARQGRVTVADVRDALGSSRKYTLPIVAWLDRTGVTRRRGDDRIPGPTSGISPP
ncbi:MAG: selenocysteine-specific translation elongation factor [Actinomycetes bacterium]